MKKAFRGNLATLGSCKKPNPQEFRDLGWLGMSSVHSCIRGKLSVPK